MLAVVCILGGMRCGGADSDSIRGQSVPAAMEDALLHGRVVGLDLAPIEAACSKPAEETALSSCRVTYADARTETVCVAIETTTNSFVLRDESC